MPSKYQTDQYPTHQYNSTKQIRLNSYHVTWQLLYQNWLDLILSKTVLRCPTQLHQPLSLLSRTLSLYTCLITSYHYQIQILFNYVSTETYTTLCSVYDYCIPEILPFCL